MTKKHSIKLENTGSGGGTIIVHPQREWLLFGEKVSLEAVANDDSYFKSWEIRVNFKLFDNEESKNHTEITLLMPDEGEEKIFHINAIFESMFSENEAAPNEFIRAVLDTIYTKSFGDDYHYYYKLQLYNLKEFSINVKVPLTDKIINNGKKVPQKKWGGSVNGAKGIKLEANGFCEIILVYLEKWQPGEEIGVEVNLIGLDEVINLRFRAPNKLRGWNNRYRLIDCQLKAAEVNNPSKIKTVAPLALLKRIDTLEARLSNALSRLDIIERSLPSRQHDALSVDQLAPKTFNDVMDWLLVAETVALSDLRARLLPLNLLIGALITDLNEKALDLTGELALEEDGNNLVINHTILQKVLGNI